MLFDFNLPTISYLLYGLALICLILIITLYCGRLRKIRRAKKASVAAVPSADMPFASVVVYASNESDTLLKNLPAMLQQHYPAGFEVIVVNDGASPETGMAASALKASHHNLYITFTPGDTRNVSRKKLGLTLGIKAAKGSVVVLADASTRPLSDRWLANMTAPFADDNIGVVLGIGRYKRPERIAGQYTRIFDQAADTTAWLTAALAGRPYRGCGFNLAYRRQLFFDNKGFSSSLNMRNGDDDIFVNEITNRSNTVAQLTDEAMVERDLYPYAKASRDLRTSHAFTGRRLPKASRRIMAMGEWCMWITMTSAIAAAITSGVHNMWSWTLTATLIIALWSIVAASWHSVMRLWRVPHLAALLPIAAMTRPLRNIVADVRARISPASHYTWL